LRIGLLQKLTAAFLLIALLAGGAGLYVVYQLDQVDRAFREVVDYHDAAALEAHNMQVAIISQSASIRGLLLIHLPERVTQYEKAAEDFQVAIDAFLRLANDPTMEEKANQLLQWNNEYAVVVQQVVALEHQGRTDEAVDLHNRKGVPIIDQIVPAANSLATEYEVRAENAAKAADELAQTSEIISLTVIALSLVVAVVLGVYLARTIATAVRQVAAVALKVADGDLRVEQVRVRSNDEVGDLGHAMNKMLASLQALIAGVSQSTRAVSGAAAELSEASGQASQASGQVATAVTQVAGGAARQAEASTGVNRSIAQLQQAIEQVAAGSERTSADVQKAVKDLEEMITEVDGVTQAATANAEAAAQAATVAGDGAHAVEQTIAGMGRIRQAVGNSAGQMRQLATLSEQIGEITTTISEIADQTNLLALNAAIEAARAGEHGRGFAVVADEVRKLAERAARSSGEIARLIESIQGGTRQAVQAMDAGSAEVEAGVHLATEAGRILEQIRAGTTQSAAVVRQIAESAQSMRTSAGKVATAFEGIAAVTEENTASSEEMAASATEVTRSVNEIASIAQENAAVAEEVSASTEEVTASAQEVSSAARELQQIADRLAEQVARFQIQA